MNIVYNCKIFVMLLFLIAAKNVEKDQHQIKPEIVRGSPHDSVIILNEFNISLQELISLAKWSRNPFLPYYSLIAEDPTISDLLNDFKLRKIFYEKDQRKALINTQKVKQGDFYLDLKIQYIGESLVILGKDGSPGKLLKIKR